MPSEEIIQRRSTGWLAVLERELKLRIGWVDEALTPFARPIRTPEPAAGGEFKSAA